MTSLIRATTGGGPPRQLPHWSNALADAWREDVWAEVLPRAVRGAHRFQLRQARALDALAAARHHRLEGAASIEEYGLRAGLGPQETRDLVRLGAMLRVLPEAEAAFLDGRLPLASAGWLALALEPNPPTARELAARPVADDPPPAAQPAHGWLALACASSPRDFGDLVRRVRAERRTGRRMLRISVLLSDATLARWKRARKVLRHQQKRAVSEDELLAVLCQEYLDRHDPTRVPSRTRRLVSDKDPRGRHVPAAVQRAVIERDGLRCRHPGCEMPGPYHLGHIHPYAEGGPPRAENLVLECATHNDLVRMGMVQVVGPAWNPGFRYRFDGQTHWSAPARPYAWAAEEQKQRAEVVHRRQQGQPVPPTRWETVFAAELELAGLPATSALPVPVARGGAPPTPRPSAAERAARPPGRCPNGYRTEPRLPIPYLDARDGALLERWLDDWFGRYRGNEAAGGAMRAERVRARPPPVPP